MPNIILRRTRTYIRLYRKVDLLSRTEKRYLWLAEVNFRNYLSIIYMYTQRSRHNTAHHLNLQNRNTILCVHIQYLYTFKKGNEILSQELVAIAGSQNVQWYKQAYFDNTDNNPI